MRNVKDFFLIALLFIPVTVVAQTSPSAKNSKKSSTSKNESNNSKPSPKLAPSSSAKNADKVDETKAKAVFDELKNVVDTAERIEKLNKFIADFPRSELKPKAVEMLIVSHVEAGEAGFQSKDSVSGVEHFRAAAAAFEPSTSDNIFNDLIGKLPFNLLFRGQREAADEVAKEIESKISENAPRLLTLANFYLSNENANDAKRLATRAAEIAPDSAAAQMALGMAHRIAFHLEAASQSYARALELDPASVVAKRNLADAWRGLGQTDDALKIYRELIEANAADEAARNGLILALFNSGNKEEAEKELARALEQNPKNLILEANAAYWYAANGDGKRAIELAQKAVEIEPRYVWGQIALARGLLLEKRPLEAERALVTARQFGKFPTLDYELASAHFAAGLYEEAADDLRRSFKFENGKLQTKLAGRESAEAENFNELLSRERRASTFEPTGASGEMEARKLKELIALTQDLQANPDKIIAENELLKTAQNFTADADEMSVYRELYAANKLLNRKIALEQVFELTRTATDGLEKSLDVPAATAAVLADELYEPRRLAANNGNIVNIPTLPRETLRQIMRGRVEEIAGWTLYQQNKLAEAVIRLRRAVGVLPENSAWWRSSYWKLGSALEAGGNSKDALNAYLKSYKTDAPNETRFVIIQALYQRVYGSLDGLEKKLTQNDASDSIVARRQTASRSVSSPAVPASFKNPLPNIIAELAPPKLPETPKIETPNVAESTPEPTPETKPAINTEVAPKIIPPPTPPDVKNETVSIVQPEPTVETTSTPEIIAAPTPEAKSEPTAQSSPESEIKTEEKPDLETPIVAKSADQIASNVENKSENKVEDKAGIISAPVVEPIIESAPALPPAENKLPPASEPIANSETSSTENNLAEKQTNVKNSLEKVDSAAIEKADADSALARPRVIIRSINPPLATINQTESETKTAPSVCLMQSSLSEVSILRNGGTVAFLVTFNDAASAAKLNASVNSPSDINVILLPSDDPRGDHRLIQISSISEITKMYTITLESPCGKQEIKVKVR